MLHLVKINGIYERRPVKMPLQITSRKWHHYEFLGYENITALVILAGMEQFFLQNGAFEDKVSKNLPIKK